jgi:hypothetical protein
MDKANSGAGPTDISSATVAFDVPSAQLLADQAAIIQDLQFVMECCKRLLSELVKPEDERDPVVPQALWSAALVAYARCFSTGKRKRFGLTIEDVRTLPLEGAVAEYHKWLIDMRNTNVTHPADPSENVRVGAVLSPPPADRRLQGIVILPRSRVLVDETGVRQMGGLAAELAKQVAENAKEQQDVVLADAQLLSMDVLYALPPLPTQGPAAAAAGDAP